MDSGVSGQLVGSREAFCASRELTGVWLLASVCSNVSGLMLKAVEGLIAEWTLVWSRQILSLVLMLTSDHGGHHADCGHFCFSLLPLDLSQLLSSSFLFSLELGQRLLSSSVVSWVQ